MTKNFFTEPNDQHLLDVVLPEMILRNSVYRNFVTKIDNSFIDIDTILSGNPNDPFSEFAATAHTISTQFDPTKVVDYQDLNISNNGDDDDGQPIFNPLSIQSNQTDLFVDQAKVFRFNVPTIDDTDASRLAVRRAWNLVAQGIVAATELYIATSMYAAAPYANTIGSTTTPKVPTDTTAAEYIADQAKCLDNFGAPATDRFCIVPPWYMGFLRKDTRFTPRAKGDRSEPDSYVGECAGMSIYTSLNTPNDSGVAKYKIIAGHPSGMQLAEKVMNVKRYDDTPYADAEHGDGVGIEIRGEYVLGVQPVNSAFFSAIIANKS